MKKIALGIIFSLSLISLYGVTHYTFFIKKKKEALALEESIRKQEEEKKKKEEELATPLLFSKTVTTKKGLTISLTEKKEEDRSLLTVTTNNASSSPILLSLDTITNATLLDMNKDGNDELLIFTVSGAQSAYGEVILYTEDASSTLSQITTPILREDDMGQGGLFEGYRGYDSFVIENETLFREFPIYLPDDSQNSPTGKTKKVMYSLKNENNNYYITIEPFESNTLITKEQATTSKK